MPTYQLQPITDETLAHLPESKYHRFGGWLVVFVVWLGLHCLYYVFGVGIIAARMAPDLFTAKTVPASDYWGITLTIILSILCVLVLPAITGGLSLIWLLRRKIKFRIPFVIYAASTLFIVLCGGSFVRFMFLTALWLIYVFTSDRVRVFCGIRPKRPVPMPILQESEES